jgi:hypothetical protein
VGKERERERMGRARRWRVEWGEGNNLDLLV